MGLTVTTGSAARSAARVLATNDQALRTSLERLSLGLRINRAADDAAGLAVSEGLRSRIGGTVQALRNARDGISVLQTAEGALQESAAILQRMRDLAVRAANDGAVDAAGRSAVQAELGRLRDELDRIAGTTTSHGNALLDGTWDRLFQVGAGVGETIGLRLGTGTDAVALGLADVDVTRGEPAVRATRAMGPDGTDSPTAAALVFEGVTLVAGGVASLTGTISLDGLSLDLGAVVHPDPEGDGVPNAEAVTQLNAAARAAGFGWPHDPFLDDGDDLLFRGPLPAADATTADLAAATPAYAPATGAPPVTVSTVPALPPDSPAAGSLVLLGAAAGGQLGRLTGTVSVGGRGLDLGRVRLVDTTGDQVVSTAEALAQLGAAAQAAGLTSGDSFTVVGEDVVFRGPVPADDATAEEVAAASPVYRPATGAPAAIRAVDRAIGLVSAQRAELGAVQNRLEHTIGRLGVALENATAAESRIRDTDMAQEMTRFARGQVLIQAGTAMLAQANQSAQRVLSLLQP
ncbi:hypothetical protein GCM10023328_02010 [Modestobacter marinus]|uniref:Flagellin n=1 Tax=Modestobacter marinus TaxID=477641 RepID=A0A846LPT0_9ACTN|nr:flagellin [Modestobacter marinus]NIH67368.1 flagellin [Modestobacter marinus]GGL54291.1 hypothetical protein GCM10011589_07950 [Modestobacter marinus]